LWVYSFTVSREKNYYAFVAVVFSAFDYEHDPTISQEHAYKVTLIYYVCMVDLNK